MLASADVNRDFSILNQQYRQLVLSLLEVVKVPELRLEVEVTEEGSFRGFDGNHFYLVESGSLGARYRGRLVYTLEPGDLLLPDVTGVQDQQVAVTYGSDSGAVLLGYPALEFMSRVFSDPSAIKLWTRLLVTYSGIMLRLAAARLTDETPTSPGFEVYEPGEIIIRQGEQADYVFNMSEGTAEVLVNDVAVGRIGVGETFGAMAALTNGNRTATVRSLTTCSVVKVPKEQFTDLIRSNPETIHSLLVDMANSIVNLNQQLVGMSRE